MSENPDGERRDDEPRPAVPLDKPTTPEPAAEPQGGYPPPPTAGSYPPPPAAGAYPPPPAAGAYPPPPASGGPSPYGQGTPPPAPPVPPAGAYPPPGGYPPPAGGYPAPSPTTPIGEALSYGWGKFTTNGGVFIAASLIWVAIAAVALFLVSLVFGGFAGLADPDGDGVPSGMGLGFSFGYLIITTAFWLLAYLVQAAFIRVSLNLTYGRPARLGDFFSFENSGLVVLAALLLAAINLVVGLVAWIPVIGWLVSVAVNFLVVFTLWFVIDKQLQPVDAVRSSIQLITANLSTTILFYLVGGLILVAGAVLCGIGLLVALPVVLVATSYLYRRLLGEPIAP